MPRRKNLKRGNSSDAPGFYSANIYGRSGFLEISKFDGRSGYKSGKLIETIKRAPLGEEESVILIRVYLPKRPVRHI